MTELFFDCKIHEEGPDEMVCKIEGDGAGVILAVSRLINHVYWTTPEYLRPIFKDVIQHLTVDESPVWEPVEMVEVDLKAMRENE